MQQRTVSVTVLLGHRHIGTRQRLARLPAAGRGLAHPLALTHTSLAPAVGGVGGSGSVRQKLRLSAFVPKMADGPSAEASSSSAAASSDNNMPAPKHHQQHHQQQQQQQSSQQDSDASCLKIASAVVLVERSEIAKLKVSGASGASCGAQLRKDATAIEQPAPAKKSTRKAAAEAAKKAAKRLAEEEQQQQQQQQQQHHHHQQQQQQQQQLVGPCAKKRCADRYDSSESSDSGVAVSCGDCSSSNSSSSLSLSSASSTTGSDITEPGSPCSTSSDEGVSGVRSSSSSLSSNAPSEESSIGSSGTESKLAPTQQQLSASRPQWPWTPPLATTACTTSFKRFKAEPEHGSLPGRQAGQVDPGSRHGKAATNKQDSQGKITEYFKTQIKPQQTKTKKSQSSEVSVLVSKTAEFRRPATVQRKNGALGKQSNTRSSSADWEVRAALNGRLTGKKSTMTTTINGMKSAGLPILPIPSDVLSSLPACKISNLRLTSEASPSESPPPTMDTPTSIVGDQIDQFKDDVQTIHMMENNNLPSSVCDKDSDSLLSRLILPPTPSDSTKDEDEEEESSRDSAESKRSSLDSLSPILSAPTTIRFPVKAPGKQRGQTTDSGSCRWVKCGVNCETTTALLEHLQAAHINTQTGGDNFICQWQGCKVQGRSSCSRRWLERHVLSHGGNKPFQCIVDGCGSRFSSQTALERHVNGHFNQSETSSTTSRKSTDSGGKLVRRNGKKLRYRRQPWSARIFDYFDPGVMESLQHRLLELAKMRTQGHLAETPGDSMTLTSQVIGRRVELDGKTRVLLRWYPQDIEPDQWVLESEVCETKYVNIRSIAMKCPDEVNVALYPALNTGRPSLHRVKQRRKPVKMT